MLPGGLLKELTACAQQYQLEPLVEVFTSDVVPAALNSGCKVIGINARNLRTLEMKEENVFLLARLIPNDRVIVAESGIKTAADVERLKSIRVSAILVGESLLREADPAQTLRALVEAGMRQ
jgi:indole-3-glycerol phosphate synthase